VFGSENKRALIFRGDQSHWFVQQVGSGWNHGTIRCSSPTGHLGSDTGMWSGLRSLPRECRALPQSRGAYQGRGVSVRVNKNETPGVKV